MRALIIPAVGSPEIQDIDGGDFRTIQELVGGHFQVVNVDKNAHLYVDEDGKFKDYLINVLATVLAFPDGGDVIVGNAVMLSHKGPQDVDVSDDALNMVLSFIEAHGGN